MDSRLVVHGGHDGNKWVADMHILAALLNSVHPTQWAVSGIPQKCNGVPQPDTVAQETSQAPAPHEGLVWHKAGAQGIGTERGCQNPGAEHSCLSTCASSYSSVCFSVLSCGRFMNGVNEFPRPFRSQGQSKGLW